MEFGTRILLGGIRYKDILLNEIHYMDMLLSGIPCEDLRGGYLRGGYPPRHMPGLKTVQGIDVSRHCPPIRQVSRSSTAQYSAGARSMAD